MRSRTVHRRPTKVRSRKKKTRRSQRRPRSRRRKKSRKKFKLSFRRFKKPKMLGGAEPEPELEQLELEVLQTLTEGSQGVIYRIKTTDETDQVVKVPKNPEELDAERLAMEILQPQHPNIVTFVKEVVVNTSTGQSRGIVMEYGGENLRQLSSTGIHPNMALGVMYEILKGVKFIHSKKYAHLDLKPENILAANTSQILEMSQEMSQRTDISGEKILGTCKNASIKICDFGFFMPDKIPRSGQYVGGTAGYRAPEITQMVMIFPPSYSDLFSLGATLYDLCNTGNSKLLDEGGRDYSTSWKGIMRDDTSLTLGHNRLIRCLTSISPTPRMSAQDAIDFIHTTIVDKKVYPTHQSDDPQIITLLVEHSGNDITELKTAALQKARLMEVPTRMCTCCNEEFYEKDAIGGEFCSPSCENTWDEGLC